MCGFGFWLSLEYDSDNAHHTMKQRLNELLKEGLSLDEYNMAGCNLLPINVSVLELPIKAEYSAISLL